MDIKFHCDETGLFMDKNNKARAFLYPDYKIEAHSHDFYEINIVFSGSGVHQIENSCINVNAGDVFVISPMVVHSYYDTKNLDVYHIVLHKDFILENKDEAYRMPGFLQFMEIEPFLRQHSGEAMFLHLNQSQLLQLKNELIFIEDNGEFDSQEFIPLKKHTLWKIIYFLSSLLFKQIHSGKNKYIHKYNYEIILALEYIHQNYEKKITIEDLCKLTFLSRSTFFRSFSEICTCTSVEYINSYRCKKALEMMEKTKSSKTEIAINCGFYDLSHLEKALKHYLSEFEIK